MDGFLVGGHPAAIGRVKRHNSRKVSRVIFLLPSRGASRDVRLVCSQSRNRDQRAQHHDESPAYNSLHRHVSSFSESTEILSDELRKGKIPTHRAMSVTAMFQQLDNDCGSNCWSIHFVTRNFFL